MELSFHPTTQCAIKSKLQTRAIADVVVDWHGKKKKGPSKKALRCSIVMDC